MPCVYCTVGTATLPHSRPVLAPHSMKWMRDTGVMQAAWGKLPEEKREGKFPIGLLHKSLAEDYVTAYQQVIEIAGGNKA